MDVDVPFTVNAVHAPPHTSVFSLLVLNNIMEAGNLSVTVSTFIRRAWGGSILTNIQPSESGRARQRANEYDKAFRVS